MFLKLVKGKIFAFSPKPRPSWGLCRGDGLWVFLQYASHCVDFCLRLVGNLVFCPGPRPANPLTGVFIEATTLVALNSSTRAHEILLNAWETEQGSCLLKRVQM